MVTTESTTSLPLPAEGQVQVWLLAESDLAPPISSLLSGWLSSDEHARWQRFHASADRQRFLHARALVRAVLARYCRCDPAALQFASDLHGKPYLLTDDAQLKRLRFNLSHARGMCALAVAVDMEVGIDVENQARDVEMLALAERFFAPQEVAQLRALPEAALRAGFFRLWTLKEAYVKARGLGLKLGLATFGFDLAAATPRLQFAGDDTATDWTFAAFNQQQIHVAVAARHRQAAVNIDTVTWLS